jgi:YHS domain-containing protein
MNVIRRSIWSTLILGAAVGCAGEDQPAPASAPNTAPAAIKPAAPATKPADSKKGDEAPEVEGPKTENSKSSAGDAKLSADELAAIKELPPAEQELATKQLVCPVSAHNLGSMGKPLKVTAEGRTFYLCCDNCEDKVKADPKGVIAKLDKKGN